MYHCALLVSHMHSSCPSGACSVLPWYNGVLRTLYAFDTTGSLTHSLLTFGLGFDFWTKSTKSNLQKVYYKLTLHESTVLCVL